MKQVFVDTGAWYALIDRKDPDHIAVSAVLHNYRKRLTTTNFVIDETVTLLRYRLNWEVACEFGDQIRTGNLTYTIRVQPADEDAAWKIFKRYQDKAFSFTDCTSFAVMERLKIITAVALDCDFRRYGLDCLPNL